MKAVTKEACIQSVSTRSVDDLVMTMGMTGGVGELGVAPVRRD